jgi:cytochrome c-type biogenesis protein CcmE
MIRKKIVRAFVVILLSNAALLFSPAQAQKAHTGQSWLVQSPDKKIKVQLTLKDGEALYDVRYMDDLVLQQSGLGLVREDGDFSKELKFVSESKIALVKDNYDMVNAKKHHIQYSANRKIYSFKNSAGEKINILFQVSNDGVAYRY